MTDITDLTDLSEYGYIPSSSGACGAIPARVTAVHKERYALVCKHGEIYGRLKAKEYYGGFECFPTVGDFVMIDYIPAGDSRIVATLPRRTYFSRRDPTPGRGEQAVAANFDYVFIMQSLNFNFNIRRMERYLAIAWQSGAVPVIILTKADLADDLEGMLSKTEAAAPGVDIHAVSVKSGYGLSGLSDYLKPLKTIVFLGSSGVGKSSLVNALAGEEVMDVNGIREDDSRGRHTTTHRQLIKLGSGVMVIDTPGMRELGMWNNADGIDDAFSDIEEYIGRCRYSDCRHDTEPGCAIKAALQSGSLSAGRWESYLKLHSEAEYTEDKTVYARKKQQWHKDVTLYHKNKNKEIW